MSIQTIMIYYEVNKILDVLGEEYTSKLPSDLYSFIKESAKKIKRYDDLMINTNNLDIVKKKTAAMITLFNLNYWCDSDEKKLELSKALKK